MRRLMMTLMAVGLVTTVHAFPCYITMVKDSCWTEYDLSVDVIDVSTEKRMTTIVIAASKTFKRHEFVCEPKQTYLFKATFSPSIWEQDTGRVYSGKRYWSFPDKISKGQGAWNMTVCFSGDFSEVPLPPEGSNQCVCNKDGLPKIEPR